MSARMMARLVCVVGIALCTLGYSRCTFVSGDPPPDVNPPLPGNFDFLTTLTLRDVNGTESVRFVMGEPIRFDLEVLNRTNQSATLQFPDAQIYDFYVLDPGTSRIRWRWSANMSFPQVSTQLVFLPNSSKEYSIVWNGVLDDGTQLPAGSYVARGIMVSESYNGDPMASNDLASQLVNFTVR